MRAFLTAAIASSVVGLSCAGGGQVAAQSGESTVRRVAVTAATPVFTVDLVHGAITVAGHDAPYIEFVVTRTTSAKTDADRAAADREVRLDVVEGPEGATLCASMPYRERCDDPDPWRRGRDRDDQRPGYTVSFDVVAKVPRTTRVVVKTIDGGPLRISDLDGPVDARHVNGGIDAAGLAQGGRLRTVNGDVRLTLPTNPRAPLSVETVNGDVVAQFAAGLSADFWIASAFGRVFSEFDVTRLAPMAPVADRSDGHLRYRFDRAFGIRVGQGGPAHRFTTLNGDICIVARGQ
jgi:hypothetical protein